MNKRAIYIGPNEDFGFGYVLFYGMTGTYNTKTRVWTADGECRRWKLGSIKFLHFPRS